MRRRVKRWLHIIRYWLDHFMLPRSWCTLWLRHAEADTGLQMSKGITTSTALFQALPHCSPAFCDRSQWIAFSSIPKRSNLEKRCSAPKSSFTARCVFFFLGFLCLVLVSSASIDLLCYWLAWFGWNTTWLVGILQVVSESTPLRMQSQRPIRGEAPDTGFLLTALPRPAPLRPGVAAAWRLHRRPNTGG